MGDVVSKSWTRERRQDPYYKSAKAGGYRARSAFKLQQINGKFKIIRRGNVVVDLGAAPGGWSQVAVELVGENGVVVGVDLAFIQPLFGATFVQGDMTSRATVDRVRTRIEERIGRSDESVDVVISDMSPNISGNYTMDQARSFHLCQEALRFATQVLKPGGHFVTKIFEGEDFPALREELKALFGHVRTFSPPASRKESSEVYVVAMGYRGGDLAAKRPETGPEETEAWWDEDSDE